MKLFKIFLLFILPNTFLYSQEIYVEKFPNGNLKIEGFLVNKTLDSLYKEYYENGKIKQEGFFKNCEYETNKIKKYRVGCGVGNFYDNIQSGKKHGTWKAYHGNGKLKTISNFHCNFFQGNFYNYDENGILESFEFYFEGDLLNAIEYYKNGIIEKNSYYTYIHNKKESKDLKTTRESEYYEDGKLRLQREIIEKEKDVEIEHINEYFPNGFLKFEIELIDSDKNGVYREYYENGNIKYEGIFKKDKPFEKQYYYSENGKINKIEYWKKGKLIKTDFK